MCAYTLYIPTFIGWTRTMLPLSFCLYVYIISWLVELTYIAIPLYILLAYVNDKSISVNTIEPVITFRYLLNIHNTLTGSYVSTPNTIVFLYIPSLARDITISPSFTSFFSVEVTSNGIKILV